MTYVYVREEGEEKLHLSRNPGQRAWAILIGLISIGLGAAYYSADYLLWKLAYLSGAVFVGLSCMEDWEDCIIDKSSGQITFKRQSLIQRLVNAETGQKLVVADVDDVVGVQVQTEEARCSGCAYAVFIQFAEGYSIGVTDTFTVGDKSEHESVAALIQRFLQLDEKHIDTQPVADDDDDPPIQDQVITSTDQSDVAVATGVDECGNEADQRSSSSDDSFEQIDKVDLTQEGEDAGGNGEDASAAI